MSNVILHPFQEKVLEATKKYNRVAYYLDMGLGKTFVASEKMEQLGYHKNLVICQKSKVDDWVNHFRQYYPTYNTYDLTDKGQLEFFISQNDIYRNIGVINYDLIFRRPELLKLKDYTLILDESSQIQNDSAKRTKFVLKMKPENVILLSGTPTSGKYENLWSQLNLIGWGISKFVYNSQYVNWRKIEVMGTPIKIVDKNKPYKNVDRLKSKMREYGAIFLKTDEVFDLPEQNFVEIHVPKTKQYKQFQKDKYLIIDGEELIGDTAFGMRLYNRMLCGQYNQAKLNAFQDLIESTNDRLIVFYNFDEELRLLKMICENCDRPISEINGHKKDLTAYETADDSVTLVQYQSGSMGLNLQKANKIIYFTPTDKSELFEQSKKRIHRIGQDKPCFYYLLVCSDSVEDNEIFPILGLRKKLTDDLFVESEEQNESRL